MREGLSLGGTAALGLLLVLALGALVSPLPAVEAFGIQILGLEGASAERWLALVLRLAVAAVTPLALLGVAQTRDPGLRSWPSRVAAMALSLAFLFALAAALGPLLTRSFASILALLAIVLAAGLARSAGAALTVAGSAEADRRWKARDALWLLALVVATMLLRALTYEEAFGRDLMVYVTVAERWLGGAALYAEVWDHKPPAALGAVAFFVWLFGPTPLAIYLLGLSCFALTLIGVHLAARRFAGRAAAYPAGLLWFAFGNDPLLGANQPNVESLILPCMAWSFALLAGREAREGARWTLVGARRAWALGCLFLLATAFKQVMIFLPVAVAVALLLPSLFGRNGAWRGALGDCLRFAAVGLLGWLATFAYFWAVGSFAAFYDAVFAYNQTYAGNILANIAKGFLIVHRSPGAYPYVVAAIFFALIALSRGLRADHRLVAAFLIGLGLAIFAPGRYYGHYYQLLTPILAVVGGALVARLAGRWAPILLSLLAALFALTSFVRYDPDRLPVLLDARHGLESLESRRLGEVLAERLPEDASFFHWGAEPGLYFWSERPAPVDFVYNYLLLRPEGAEGTARLLATLERLRPTLVIAKRSDVQGAQHPIAAWIADHYRSSREYGVSPVFEVLVPVLE